jgi:glycosyltransferase involved in cell wall biosynthesis
VNSAAPSSQSTDPTQGGRTYRRALWVSTSLSNRGGICTYVRNARETPLWRDWHIRHVATHKDGGLGTRIVAYLVGVAFFAKELALHRPEIVHIHTASYGSFARKSLLTWWASLSSVPVVLHIHGGGFKTFFQTSPRLVRSFIRATLERADVVAALGSAWGRDLTAIAPAANICVVPNAIRLRTPVHQEDASTVNVVFLGKVCDGKGTFVLLEAWAKLINDSDCTVPARLIIAGDGEVDRARERVAALSIGDTCEVRGWLSASTVDDLLASAHVLVLPSMAEGQPMSILEAMARGLVVIASEVGGIPEMLSGGAGVLIKPGDVNGLAEAMTRVIDDPRERSRLGADAYSKAQSDFDIELVSARFDEMYRDVLSRGPHQLRHPGKPTVFDSPSPTPKP